MIWKQSEGPVFFLATGLQGWIVSTLSTLSVLLKYINHPVLFLWLLRKIETNKDSFFLSFQISNILFLF